MRFKLSKLGLLTTYVTIVYVVCDLAGEIMGNLGSNYQCLRFIGCTTGFFGFDAIEHFMSGASFLLLIALFMRKYPKYSLLVGNRFKDAFVLVCVLALIAVCWEIGECAHDYFRVVFLHEQLFSVRLHINVLDQPSNLDTVGDLFFNTLGAIVASFFMNVGIAKTAKGTSEAA